MDLMELAVKVSIDSKQAEQGLKQTEKQGEKTAGKLNKWLSEIGKGALRELGAQLTKLPGMLKNTFKTALNLAGELEQQLGGAEAVFGNYYAKITQYAESAFSSMGLSQAKFLQTANKMGSLLQGSGFKDVGTVTEMTAKWMQRAADVASVMGISTESAMEAVTGAAKGNMTMLDNLGVSVNDTALKAYAAEKGWSKAAISGMDTQKKVQLAYELFMERTAKYEGTYARENDTYAGSIATLKAAWENFLAGTGDPGDLFVSIERVLNTVIKSAKELAPKLWKGMKTMLEKAWPNVSKWLGQSLRKLPGILGNGLKIAANGIIDVINQAFGSNIPHIDEIRWPTWDEVKGAAIAAWDAIKAEAKKLAGLVFGTKADGSVDWPDWDDVVQAAQKAWQKIRAKAKEAINWGGRLIFGTKKDGSVAWPEWKDVQAKATEIWNGIKDGAKKLAGLVFGTKENGDVAWPDWEAVTNTAKEWWNTLVGWVANGANLVGKLIFGESADGGVAWPDWKTITETAKEWWGSLVAWVKDAANIGGGLIFGKKEDGSVDWPDWSDVQDAAIKAMELIQKGIDTLGGFIFGYATDESGNPVVNWPEWVMSLRNAASDAIGRIQEGINTLGGFIFGYKKDEQGNPVVDWPTLGQIQAKLSEWWDGIKDAAVSVVEWAIGIPSAPHASGAKLHHVISVWWEKVKSAVVGAISLFFPAPNPEDKDGTGTKGIIERWWNDLVVPLIKGVTDFTLGLFGLPKIDEMVRSIEDWWNNPETGVVAKAQKVMRNLVPDNFLSFIIQDSLDQSLKVIDGKESTALKLLDKLIAMGDASELAAEKQEEWRQTAEQLKTMFPSLADKFDTEALHIKGNTDEIRANIRELSNLARQKALQKAREQKMEQLTHANEGLVDKQIELEKKRSELQKKLEGQVDRRNEILRQNGIDFTIDKNGDINQQMKDLEAYLNKLDSSEGYWDKLLQQLYGDGTGQLIVDIAGLNKQIADNQASIAKMNAEMAEWEAAAAKLFNSENGTLTSGASNAEKKIEALAEQLDKLPNQKIIDVVVRGNDKPVYTHAKGLNYVPYDGYQAILHRGEQVLTASQARNKADGDGAGALSGMVADLKTTLAHLRIQVGEKEFGSTVVDYGSTGMRQRIAGFNRRRRMGYGSV